MNTTDHESHAPAREGSPPTVGIGWHSQPTRDKKSGFQTNDHTMLVSFTAPMSHPRKRPAIATSAQQTPDGRHIASIPTKTADVPGGDEGRVRPDRPTHELCEDGAWGGGRRPGVMPLAISTDSEVERVKERTPLYSDSMMERARAVAVRQIRTDGKMW